MYRCFERFNIIQHIFTFSINSYAKDSFNTYAKKSKISTHSAKNRARKRTHPGVIMGPQDPKKYIEIAIYSYLQLYIVNYIAIYSYVQLYVAIYSYIQQYIYIYIYVQLYIGLYIAVYTAIYSFMYIYIYICIYIYIAI